MSDEFLRGQRWIHTSSNGPGIVLTSCVRPGFGVWGTFPLCPRPPARGLRHEVAACGLEMWLCWDGRSPSLTSLQMWLLALESGFSLQALVAPSES